MTVSGHMDYSCITYARIIYVRKGNLSFKYIKKGCWENPKPGWLWIVWCGVSMHSKYFYINISDFKG